MTKILIVDDERGIRESFGLFLGRKGYETVMAEDYNDAIAKLEECKFDFDVILTDQVMPGRSGLDLIKTVKEKTNQIQLIMITGEPTIDTAAESVRLGIFDYLTKPLDLDRLLSVVSSAVKLKQLQDKARVLKKLADERSQALEASEDRYRRLFESTSDGIMIADLSGKILEANSQALKATGYSRKELVGKHVVEIDARIDSIEDFQTFADLKETKELKFETEIRRKDKSTFPVEMNLRIFEYMGKPAMIGVARDLTDRKRAEEEIRISESNLSAVLENAFDIILSIDPDYYILTINSVGIKRFERLLNVSPKIGDNILEIIPADLKPIFKARYDRALNGEHFVVEDQQNFGGFLYCSEVSFNPIRTENKVSGVSVISRDITERRQAEKAMREGEEIYRTLVDGVPDIIMRFDRDGRHLFVSDNVSEVVDLQSEQFIGKTHRELGFPEELCEFWEQAIQCVYDSAAPFETEFTVDGKQEPILFNWRLLPEYRGSDNVKSVLSIARDITDYRRSKQDYQMLFQEMLGGFAVHEIICDEGGKPVDYRFLVVNPSFERMTGLKAQDIVGRTVLEVLPDTEAYWIETYGKVALSGEPVFFDSYSREFNKHFEVSAYQTKANQFACVFVDISERKQAENARLEYIKQLHTLTSRLVLAEESERKRIASLLHDGLGQDLASIGLKLKMVAETIEGSEAKTELDGILDVVEKAIGDSRSLTFDLSPPILFQKSLGEALRWLFDRECSKMMIKGSFVDGTGDTAVEEPLRILLFRIYRELLFNASKHSGADALKGSVDSDNGRLLLTLEDNGKGFKRTTAKTQNHNDTGYGLFIIAERVSHLKGEMNIHSKPGDGTRIEISVPRIVE